jgi:hypothetical protein
MSYSGPISDAYAKKQNSATYSPTDKERESATYVRDQFGLAERAKQTIMEKSWLSLAFYTGRQWSRYNKVTRLLVDESPPAWRVRMVLNYILPTVETLAGKLTENRPGFMCAPASLDDDDIEAARQSEHLLDYLWHELKMPVKIHEAVKWMAVSGTVFLKCWWDDTLGDDYLEETVEQTMEYLEGIETVEENVTKEERKKSGLPVVDVLSPLEVSWDPGAKDMDTCRWMIHSNLMHIDEIRERWPKKGKYVHADSSYEMDSYSQQVVREFAKNSDTSDANTDRTMVLEYFEKPSPRHPDGYYALIAGDIVLEEQESLPYGELPFICIRHNTVPGRFAGEGLVYPTIPAQKELNKSISQRIENKNLHAQPKWRAEKGSVDRQAFTDEPGEIIFYNRTAARPPEPLPPPPLSPEHRMIEKEQIEHIQNISGVSDITRGSSPAQTSGRAIGLLSDLDSTKLGPTVRELEMAVERLSERMLWMWREYMPIEKTLQVVGRNQGVEVFAFHAEQIKNTRVRVMANSMLPKHPSYRREQIMQMYQVGILGDPADPQTQIKARRMMEFGDMDPIYGDEDKDRRYAREENHMMANGKDQDVQPWEDHITHIDECLSYMKSIDFRLLPVERQEAFEKHLAWHYHAESQSQQGQPWWQMHVQSGAEGMPPGAPAQGGAPKAPEGGAPAPGPSPGGSSAGLVGGGTPELNGAVGTRGPGRPDYESGFEAASR